MPDRIFAEMGFSTIFVFFDEIHKFLSHLHNCLHVKCFLRNGSTFSVFPKFRIIQTYRNSEFSSEISPISSKDKMFSFCTEMSEPRIISFTRLCCNPSNASVIEINVRHCRNAIRAFRCASNAVRSFQVVFKNVLWIISFYKSRISRSLLKVEKYLAHLIRGTKHQMC